MGNEERSKGSPREALAFYKHAVELDPNFAMAYARISVHYGNQQEFETAKQYVQKAYDLRDRVSERERFYITEKYHNYITGDMDKGVETLQTWARLYPNDFIPHNNLSLNYQLIGRFDDATREALEAIKLSPNNTERENQSRRQFSRFGKNRRSRTGSEETEKINPDAEVVHADRFLFAFLRRDQAAMDREAEWAKGKPEEADLHEYARRNGAL